MLEAPWSKVRQLELTRQPGVMSMGGVGSFKVGIKAPAGSTPLEIAMAGEARAAASAIPHPQPAGAAPAAVAESTVSGVPVKLQVPNTGKGKNNLKPDPAGYGTDHSVFKRDADGNITNYATFKANPKNPSTGVEPVKRVDLTGGSHYNPILKKDISTPHVQGKGIPGGVRPAEPHEIPGKVVRKNEK